MGLGLASPCRLAPAPVAEREVHAWAADRAGDRVLALDQDLYVLRVLEVGAPCEIEVGREGLVWVLRSLHRRSGALCELALLDATGGVHVRTTLGAGRELVALGARRAALLVRSASSEGEDELVVVGHDGTARVLMRSKGLVALSARGSRLCLGTARGELSIWRVGKRVQCLRRVRSAHPVVDLVPGPHAGSWLVLAAGRNGSRVELRDRALRCSWTRELAVRATRWVSGGDGRRAWLAVEERAACLALGARGSIACFRSGLPLVPTGGGIARDGGGALFLHWGAILAVDSSGRTIPGQGGFQELTDLARVPDSRRP